jgi:type IV secretory pathway TraG/TraD family ATPase VirD4
MDKVFLAKDIVLQGGLGTERPNDNQMIFGGTGSGKTMSVVLPTLCHIKESSLIGTFSKRSVVDNAVEHFKKLGYKIYVWNLANPDETSVLPDPLSYVSSDDDIQEIACQIANGNPEYKRATNFDPYWRDSSQSLLAGLIKYNLLSWEKQSMKRVIDLFYRLEIKEYGKGITTSLGNELNWLDEFAPNSIAARKLHSYTQLPYGTAGCVRDDLEKALQTMFPASIQDAMSEEGYVDFKDFATEKTAIFILTSPVRAAQYGFANLIFAIAIRRLMEFAESCENNRLPRDVKLIFDDFSCGFPIQNYEKSISTFRAAGISSMMLCQSLSQLDATYGPDNSTVILDNCSSLVYMPGGMNKRTCAYISEMINLPLDEIMFMEMGNVVVFRSGKQPVIAPRYDTLEDPAYKEFISAKPEKDKDSKDKSAKDKSEKDKDSKDKSAKDKPEKSRDSKDKSAKDKPEKSRDSKDKSAKAKSEKVKDSKGKNKGKKKKNSDGMRFPYFPDDNDVEYDEEEICDEYAKFVEQLERELSRPKIGIDENGNLMFPTESDE